MFAVSDCSDVCRANPPYAQSMRAEVCKGLSLPPFRDPAATARLCRQFALRELSADLRRLETRLASLEAAPWSLDPAIHLAALLVLRRDRNTRAALAAAPGTPLPLGGRG